MQPAGGGGNRRLFIFSARTSTSAWAGSGLRKSVRINRQLRSPIFLLRLPCAALTALVSTRESILFRVPPSFSMFPGRQVRDNSRRERGFHQTTTIGLRRLELRLDYVR